MTIAAHATLPSARRHDQQLARQPDRQPDRQPARHLRRFDRPRPSASVYRRRRAVVGGVSALFVAIVTVVAFDLVVGSSVEPASAVSGDVVAERSVTIARPGDTLWSIAETYRGDVAVTTYVDALISLNGGPSIEAGQRVVLP